MKIKKKIYDWYRQTCSEQHTKIEQQQHDIGVLHKANVALAENLAGRDRINRGLHNDVDALRTNRMELRAQVDTVTDELVQMRKSYEELQHRFNKREDVRMEQVIKDGGFTFTCPVLEDYGPATFEGFHGDQPDDDRYTDDGMYRKPANVSLSDNEWRSLTAEQREFLVRHEEIHRLYNNLLAKGIVPTGGK